MPCMSAAITRVKLLCYYVTVGNISSILYFKINLFSLQSTAGVVMHPD